MLQSGRVLVRVSVPLPSPLSRGIDIRSVDGITYAVSCLKLHVDPVVPNGIPRPARAVQSKVQEIRLLAIP